MSKSVSQDLIFYVYRYEDNRVTLQLYFPMSGEETNLLIWGMVLKWFKKKKNLYKRWPRCRGWVRYTSLVQVLITTPVGPAYGMHITRMILIFMKNDKS